jgi:ketosteroid isomerase-like protein
VSDVASVAERYFTAIRERDGQALRALFAPDAELVSAAGTFRGPDEIARFYEETAFPVASDPRPGPFVVDGDRLATEIELQLGDSRTKVADFFTIADGSIRRLVVYLLPGA